MGEYICIYVKRVFRIDEPLASWLRECSASVNTSNVLRNQNARLFISSSVSGGVIVNRNREKTVKRAGTMSRIQDFPQSQRFEAINLFTMRIFKHTYAGILTKHNADNATPLSAISALTDNQKRSVNLKHIALLYVSVSNYNRPATKTPDILYIFCSKYISKQTRNARLSQT